MARFEDSLLSLLLLLLLLLLLHAAAASAAAATTTTTTTTTTRINIVMSKQHGPKLVGDVQPVDALGGRAGLMKSLHGEPRPEPRVEGDRGFRV